MSGRELDALKARQEADGIDEQDYGETFNDFATEDFINKNIRVRPVSGVTHPDETRDGRQSNISGARAIGGLGEASQDDADENFNKIALHDLGDQREKIKRDHEAALEAARKKKAQEEKEKALKSGR